MAFYLSTKYCCSTGLPASAAVCSLGLAIFPRWDPVPDSQWARLLLGLALRCYHPRFASHLRVLRTFNDQRVLPAGGSLSLLEAGRGSSIEQKCEQDLHRVVS